MRTTFNANDAVRSMKNLNSAQALQWAKYANEEFRKLIEKDGKPSLASRRAVQVANEKIMRLSRRAT